MRYKLLYFFLSLLVIVPGTVSLVRYGLRLSIDFTGGTLWEISFKNPQINEQQIKAGLQDRKELVTNVQKTGVTFTLRAKPMSEIDHQELKTQLASASGELEEVRFESVGPTLGKELLQKTGFAVGIVSGLILLFIAWRFKHFSFGLAAILAMFHDTLVLLGSFSLLGHYYGIEIDTLFVTATLTILSFSVHDTIVVFDRIRETRKQHPQTDFATIINKSVAETMGRSVNNSMTIIFMLLALFLLGGETIKYFALALLIGTISGTYSSTFTAAPLLVVWENFRSKSKK